jgi:hypothetical protein
MTVMPMFTLQVGLMKDYRLLCSEACVGTFFSLTLAHSFSHFGKVTQV